MGDGAVFSSLYSNYLLTCDDFVFFFSPFATRCICCWISVCHTVYSVVGCVIRTAGISCGIRIPQ